MTTGDVANAVRRYGLGMTTGDGGLLTLAG